MDIHKNARLTLRRREELVQQVNVSAKTVAKWVHRYRALGSPGLLDRSSRPLRSPRRTSSQLTVQVIALRRQLHPAYQIAQATGLSTATVSRILQRAQLNRWRHLHPAPPVVRYEHSAPGDLLHLDIKGMTRYQQVSIRGDGRRRGRPQFAGWQALHVAIDDHSRLAFSRMLPNQKTETAIAFLHAAVAFYAQRGIRIRRLLTDNGSCYRSRQFPSGLRSTRHSSPLHSPLHATHQRQSRTLHPDRAPRVGLCPPLLRLTRTRPTTCPLARLLQLSSSPW